MALFNSKGVEVAQETYQNLRKGLRAAVSELPALREVLEVRTHKRAHGFALGDRVRLDRKWFPA